MFCRHGASVGLCQDITHATTDNLITSTSSAVNLAMPRLVCWVLVAILAGMAVTVTSHSQQGCVLTPNEPPTRTGQFLASQGQAVYVDGVNNSCGMDQERGTVIVPSLLGQGVLGDLRPRDCYSSMCRTRKQRELFHQKWANSSAMVYMCSEAGNSSWERLSEVQESLCGYVVNDTFTERDFTVTLWIQATADGVLLRSRLLEVYVANELILFVRTPFAGRSRGYQLTNGTWHQLALQARSDPTRSQEINMFVDGQLIDSLYFVDMKPWDDVGQWLVYNSDMTALINDVLAYSLTPFTLGPYHDPDMLINVENMTKVSTFLRLPVGQNLNSNSDVTTCAWLEQTFLAAGVNALVSCEPKSTFDPNMRQVDLTFIQQYSVPYIEALIDTSISRAPRRGKINMRSVEGVASESDAGNQLDGTGPLLHLYLFTEAPIDSPMCQRVLGRKTAYQGIVGVDSKFYNFYMIFHELRSMGDAESLVSNKQLVGLLCSMFYPDSNPDKTPRLPCQDDCYDMTDGLQIGPVEYGFEVCSVLPVENCVPSDELPTEIPAVLIPGFRGSVKDLRIYNEILTNREIAEAFNGLLPMLDIDSHCPCPDDYPQALDSETDVDVWCAKNYNTSLRTLRLLRSEQASGGFFLNEALVDGVTDFYRDDDKSPRSMWNMWLSTPGVEDISIDVDLEGVVVVKEVQLHYMTPPPDGYFLFSTRLDDVWTPRQAFSVNCQGHTWSSGVSCSPPPSILRGFTPRSVKWELSSPVAADGLRVSVQGLPMWGDSLPPEYRGDSRTQYHAFTELAVYGVEAGCMCYSEGVPGGATCDLFGQCHCLPGIDIKLAGKRCMPYAKSVSPTFGPRSGGTLVTVHGAMLDRTGDVMLGDLECNIRIRNSTHVICETPAAPNNTEIPWDVPIHLSLPCGDLNLTEPFQYRPDPILTSIEPRRSIVQGGIVQTVSGQHLDSVPNPYLLIFLYIKSTISTRSRRRRSVPEREDSVVVDITGINRTLAEEDFPANLYDIITAPCTHIDCCTMECPVPQLSSDGVNTTITADDGRIITVEAYLGVLLDNVEQYQYLNNSDVEALREYAKFYYYINPSIMSFTEKDRVRTFRPYAPYKHHSVEILGDRLQGGSELSDYTIKIGDTECAPYHLDRYTLLCHAPLTAPMDNISIRAEPRVVIDVGDISLSVGYLRYEQWWGSSIFAATAGCCSVTIATGVAFLIYACVFVRPTIPAESAPLLES